MTEATELRVMDDLVDEIMAVEGRLARRPISEACETAGGHLRRARAFVMTARAALSRGDGRGGRRFLAVG